MSSVDEICNKLWWAKVYVIGVEWCFFANIFLPADFTANCLDIFSIVFVMIHKMSIQQLYS